MLLERLCRRDWISLDGAFFYVRCNKSVVPLSTSYITLPVCLRVSRHLNGLIVSCNEFPEVAHDCKIAKRVCLSLNSDIFVRISSRVDKLVAVIATALNVCNSKRRCLLFEWLKNCMILRLCPQLRHATSSHECSTSCVVVVGS